MAEETDDCEELLVSILGGRSQSTSVAGSLIVSLNDYLKKPTIEVDLSNVLVTYLQHLRTSQIYLSNGVFNTNFAEGALLLQSAATLYAKKIDLLWDSIIAYQERMILYEERTEKNEVEFKAVEERKERFKRKRKKKEVPQHEETEQPQHHVVEDILESVIARSINEFTDLELISIMNMKEGDTTLEGDKRYNKYFENWHSRNAGPQTAKDVSKKLCPLLLECCSERDQVNDGTHYKNEVYPMTTTQLTLRNTNYDGELEAICEYNEMVTTRLLDEQTTDLLNIKKYISTPNDMNFDPRNITDCVMQMLLVHYNISIDDLYGEPEKFCSFFKHYLSALPPDRLPSDLLDVLEDRCPQQNSLDLQRLPNEVAKTVTDNNLEAEAAKNMNRFDARRKTIESRSDIDSGFFDGDMDCTGGTSEIDKCLSNRATPFTPALSPSWDVEDHFDSAIADSESQKQKCTQNVTVEEVIPVKQQRVRKRRASDEENEVKRKRRPTFKLRPTTISSLGKFECFFSQNYKSGEGEGTVVLVEYESESDDEAGADELNITTVSDLNETNKTDVLDESLASSIDPSVPNANSTFLNESQEVPHEELQDEEQVNFMEWRAFINKKVGNQTECNFDIHNEGTNIIDSIQTVGQTVKFETLCRGKAARAISRTFIAMLQLANTNNVEVLGVQSNKLSNESLELKLLSKERHHENLCDYQAPSEISYKERMNNVRAASFQDQASQPSTSNVYKKIRLR